MRSMQRFGLFIIIVFLFLSGCNGGDGGIQPPSTLSYTTNTAVYTKGVLIASNNPTSTGG